MKPIPLLCVLVAPLGCVPDAWYAEGDLIGSCGDGLDNDGDGLFDCADDGCDDRVACVDAPIHEEGQFVEIIPTDPEDRYSPDCDVLYPVIGDQILEGAGAVDGFCASGNAVQGNLTVVLGSGEGLERLGCLCAVSGTLTVSAPGADGLSWTGIETLGSLIVESLAPGATVRLDSLLGAENITVLTDLGRLELPSLLHLGGALQIVGSAIEELDASSLETAGAVVLRDVPNLGSPELGSLRLVTGPMVLEGTALSDLDDVNSIESVGADLAIRDNALLEEVVGLESLDFVGGDLLITGNDVLRPDYVTEQTAHIEVGGDRIVYDNGGSL